MSYKDILVYLDPSDDARDRLQLAASMARQHAAYLVGVDACSGAAFEGTWRERAVRLQDSFEEALGIAKISGRYRAAQGTRDDHPYAHYADLIIAPEPDSDLQELLLTGIPEEIVMNSGVPALLVPRGWGTRPIGTKIVIAWKASREATRAVHDAMPLLTRAEKVTIFTFAPESDASGRETTSLADHLKHHKIQVDISEWTGPGSEITPVEALFACLATQDADLIVAGAFSRARWLENLFGGASRDLLNQPCIPVLVSH